MTISSTPYLAIQCRKITAAAALKLLACWLGAVFLSAMVRPATAEFALDFHRLNAITSTAAPNINCNRGEGAVNCGHGGGSDPDTTPFLQELVTGDDGFSYFHVIIGDPAHDPGGGGFAQEVYIRAGGASWQGGQGSSSGGTNIFTGNLSPLAAASVSGNGTGNPTHVIMRQIINDGDMTQEFIKDRLLYKPRISQTIDNAALHMIFDVDMRNLRLDDINSTVPVVNQLTLAGVNSGGFDMALDAPDSHVTAGQYRWIPGSGPGQSGGSWEYLEGNPLDPATVDWVFYHQSAATPAAPSSP